MSYLLVGIGGGLGAIVRFIASKSIGFNINGFPLSTLIVNWTGCFLVGICYAILRDNPNFMNYRLLIITGFLGGFTTFSSFGWEALQLLLEGKWKIGMSYILLSNVLGIILVFAGIQLILKIKEGQ